MRNLKEYTNVYEEHVNSNFEGEMVKFRRRKLLEILEKFHPRRVLEVGCGMDSLFNHYSEFDSFTVVEPSEKFYCCIMLIT